MDINKYNVNKELENENLKDQNNLIKVKERKTGRIWKNICACAGNVPLSLKLTTLIILPIILVVGMLCFLAMIVVIDMIEKADASNQLGQMENIFRLSNQVLLSYETYSYYYLNRTATRSIHDINSKIDACVEETKNQIEPLKGSAQFENVLTGLEGTLDNLLNHHDKIMNGNYTNLELANLYDHYQESLRNFVFGVRNDVSLRKADFIMDWFDNLDRASIMLISFQSITAVYNVLLNETTIPMEWIPKMAVPFQNIKMVRREATIADYEGILNDMKPIFESEFGKTVLRSMEILENNPYGINEAFLELTQQKTMNTSEVTEKFEYILTHSLDLLNSALDQSKIDSIMVFVVSGILCIVMLFFVLVCLPPISCSIYVPHRTEIKRKSDENALVAIIAKYIADLHLDNGIVDEFCSKNPKELSSVERDIRSIVLNLKKFKPYIPQPLLEQLETKRKENELRSSIGESIKETTNTMSFAGIQDNETEEGSVVSYNSKLSSSFLNDTQTTFSVVDHQSIKSKNITMLFIDIEHAHKFDTGSLQQIHQDILTNLMQQTKKNGGVFLGFSGDHFVSSFNSISTCFNHQQRACETAFQLSTILERFNTTKWNFPCNINMYIMNDDVYQGTLGNQHFKAHTTFSPRISFAYHLIKYNKTLNHPRSRIILDKNVFEQANLYFNIDLVDAVTFFDDTLNANRIERIYVLSGKKKSETDEWMYEVDRLEKQERILSKYLESGWENLFKGKLENVANALEKIQTEPNANEYTFEVDLLLKRLEEHKEEKRSNFVNPLKASFI